jgi:hypothetical protein
MQKCPAFSNADTGATCDGFSFFSAYLPQWNTCADDSSNLRDSSFIFETGR